MRTRDPILPLVALVVESLDPAAATGSEEHIMTVFRQVRDEIKQKFLDYYDREIKKSL